MKKNILYLFVPFCIKSNLIYLQNNDNNLYYQTKPLQTYTDQCDQNLERYGLNNLQNPPVQGNIVNNYENQNQLLTVFEKYYSILSETFNTLNNKVHSNKKAKYNDCCNWKLELDFLHNQFMLLKNGVKDLLELVLQNPSELERNYANSILTSIENRTLILEGNILDLKDKLNKKIIKMTKNNLNESRKETVKMTKRNLTKSQGFFSKLFS